MKRTMLLGIHLIAGVLMIFLSSYKQNKETEVKITGIRSARGQLVLAVFKDQASYDAEKPCKTFLFDKKDLLNGSLTMKCELEAAVYGITLVDDENGNGKIDKNLIGIPKEGFGFSNFFMEKLKKPTFDDFKVDLKSHPTIDIKVKYM
ncbi:DUF2141 domain-containing protein [Mucilaginibacter sp. X5P1]|uniref:DUF2141 domain-containing protein n=1 Tax=Mucilaginibacter sp. X5P1 TaxID=2723088 RepID=UPI0017A73CEC|nr:DUF2141 domain-containing protein [Mucilaginibacter sp. X5P1]MBB6139326.1 uncharacterized protein (DUF2141 family) [Mucilaginibacter sp. X5P1]